MNLQIFKIVYLVDKRKLEYNTTNLSFRIIIKNYFYHIKMNFVVLTSKYFEDLIFPIFQKFLNSAEFDTIFRKWAYFRLNLHCY